MVVGKHIAYLKMGILLSHNVTYTQLFHLLRCPESNGDTDEINVISNGNSTTSSFEFTSFEWRNLSKQEL